MYFKNLFFCFSVLLTCNSLIFSMQKDPGSINEKELTIEFQKWDIEYVPKKTILSEKDEAYLAKSLSFIQAYQEKSFLICEPNCLSYPHYEKSNEIFIDHVGGVNDRLENITAAASVANKMGGSATCCHLNGMASIDNPKKKKEILLGFLKNFSLLEKHELQLERFYEYITHRDIHNHPNQLKIHEARIAYEKAFRIGTLNIIKEVMKLDLGPTPLCINAMVGKMIADVENNQFQPPVFKTSGIKVIKSSFK